MEKEFISATPVADQPGNFIVKYEVTVVNPNETRTEYTLTDTPKIDASLTLNGAPKVSALREGQTSTITTDYGANNVLNLTSTGPVAISGGARHTYTLEIPVKFAEPKTINDYGVCTGTEDGTNKGLFNTATVEANGETSDAWACGDLPKLSVSKSRVIGETGPITVANDGTFEARFEIKVRNDSAQTIALPDILDDFKAAEGVLKDVNTQVTEVLVNGVVAEKSGEKYYVYKATEPPLTLQRGTAKAFIITVKGKMNTNITAQQWEDLGKCAAGQDISTSTTGLRNHVEMNNDSDGDSNNWACIPVTTEPKANLVVKKVDANSNSIALDGAGFAVFTEDYAQRFDLKATRNPGELVLDCAEPCLLPNADGTAKKYYLVETQSPVGMSLLAEPIPFTVAKQNNQLVLTGTPTGDFITWNTTQGTVSTATVTVGNFHIGTLPRTGGLGFGPWVALGLLIAALGAVVVRRA